MSDRQAAENQELRERVKELESAMRHAMKIEAENKRLRATIHNELPMLEVESPASFRRIRAALKEKP